MCMSYYIMVSWGKKVWRVSSDGSGGLSVNAQAAKDAALALEQHTHTLPESRLLAKPCTKAS